MIATELRVRYYETDMMEIAHHTNHLRWFEMGRVEFFRHCGIDLLEMADKGIVYPITKLECQYKEPANFDDILRVEVEVQSLSRAQCTFTYRIVRVADEKLICTGMTQNVFTHRETGKITRLPDCYYHPLQAAAEGA